MKVREKLTYTTLIDPTSDGSTCSDLDDLKVSKLKRQNVESIEYRLPSLYLFFFNIYVNTIHTTVNNTLHDTSLWSWHMAET